MIEKQVLGVRELVNRFQFYSIISETRYCATNVFSLNRQSNLWIFHTSPPNLGSTPEVDLAMREAAKVNAPTEIAIFLIFMPDL